MHVSKMKLERVPSTESAATMVSARCNQAENSWSQESIICELTKRLSEREAELRAVTREKELLVRKKPNIKGPPVELEKAYESLMARLGEREEEFRLLAQKNEYLVKRQNELEKITRELHNTMKFQRSLMHEKDKKLSDLQNQLDNEDQDDGNEVNMLRRQITLALDSQRAAINEKNDLLQKLTASEQTVRQLTSEIEQHVTWQNETMAKATEQETALAEQASKVHKLESINADLKVEIERLREKIKEDKVRADKRDRRLESAQLEIADLQAQVEALQNELSGQKKIIKVFEDRFVTKGENILELNARVENAEKVWAKIEEREKKFTLKECTSNILREENDNLRLEQKRLRSEINELNEAFELYNLQFAQDGEKIDMPYFLSKLRETVHLNNRIAELEKLVQEKGYVSDVFQAECDLREKERCVASSIDALNHVLTMLKSLLNEEEVEAPRVIGKLEEALLLWAEKTGIEVDAKFNNEKESSGDDKGRGITWKNGLVDLEIEVGCQDSQDISADYDDDNYDIEDDDITVNTGFSMSKYMDDARCVDLRQFGVKDKDKVKFFEFIRNMKVGLKSIQKEGMSIAADVNAFLSQEIHEMAAMMDRRDDREAKAKPESTSNRG
ncbi:hypothetical protein HJC23_012328 [Cyclotella cryptica]|uniref:Uncharacterized protein n=1 Tax=Cyclotella cryptica TaxID=29204 RepID=A0ABD3QD55_9STRA|eukprot:CCRYP_006521-RA/>CCRYP_006521-RA protein AED:0.18 eAED:0.18 QI:0/-1/0/1/-1/1/1/0/618